MTITSGGFFSGNPVPSSQPAACRSVTRKMRRLGRGEVERISEARRMAAVKSPGRAEAGTPSMACSTRERSGVSSASGAFEPAEVSTTASSESEGNCRARARALSLAWSNTVPPPRDRRRLAESSSTITAPWASSEAAGTSAARSVKGRAKISGSAAAVAVRASSSRISRSRRRAEIRFSERSNSCMAAKRTGVARRFPMRWTSQGMPAASRPRRREGAPNCILGAASASGRRGRARARARARARVPESGSGLSSPSPSPSPSPISLPPHLRTRPFCRVTRNSRNTSAGR
jgi:hypothetical protein